MRGRTSETALGRRLSLIASRYPQQTALVWSDGSLSYEELERRSALLGGSLQALGVEPGDRVGLLLDRSPELMIGILATVRAGAVYVPLDPANPARRLEWMAEDCALSLLLTDEGLPRLATAPCPVHDIARLTSGQFNAPDIDAEAPAYVMYTSGSTGTPKGVLVPHRGILRLVCDADYARLDRDTRVLQLAPNSFDAATFEIWGPWLNGGCLVLAPPQMQDLATLGRLIAEERINTLWLTASMFNLVVDEAVEILEPLKQLLTGGEALSLPHARRALAALPDVTLINGYGPTENTTFTTCYTVPRDIGEALPYSPLGFPIHGTFVRVLGDELEPLAPGEIGELCLGGEGLALGYLNRPELTAERFVDDPEQPGRRLYRSGDLGRVGPDGAMEFHGRRDQQVKIRGYRVEPGEVEAALAQLDGVRQAVVLATEPGDGEVSLVAFVVGDGKRIEAKDIRERLAERLPAWMIPSRFVVLEALPLNANGKADRQRLLAEASRGRLPVHEARAPVDELEARVLEVYRAVLRNPGCQPDDPFFDLGGHSIQALQIARRLETEIGQRVPLLWLYDHESPAALARALRDTHTETSPPAPGDVHLDPLPELSYPHERLWFLQQRYPECRAYQFQATLELAGPLDVTALERALGELVRRHSILRSTFPLGPEGPVLTPHDPQPFVLEPLEVDEVSAFLAAEFLGPIDMAEGPLVRWRLLRLGPERHLLALTEHHLVHDGWSFNIVLDELQQLYRAYREGRPSPLPPAADFATVMSAARARYEQSEQEADERFWREALAGCSPRLDLPWDFAPSGPESFEGHTTRVPLSRRLLRAHAEMARSLGTTPFVTMLTALLVLLKRHSGQEEICIGSGAGNRTDPALERLPGMLVNTLLLRFDLAGDPTVAELARRVHRRAAEAWDHQGMPFDRIVALLRQHGSLADWSGPEVMFSMHSSPAPVIDWPDLRVRVTVGLTYGTAKSPLNLVLLPEYSSLDDPDDPDAPAMTLIWEHGSARFAESTMKAWREEYLELLQELARLGSAPVSDLVGGRRRPVSSSAPALSTPASSTAAPLQAPSERDRRLEHVRGELTRIWSEWFDGPALADHERFFDLGGHSLLAVRLMFRVREAFGVVVPLAVFFEEPTIAGLATAILDLGETSGGGLWRTVVPGPAVRPLFVVPGEYAREEHWQVALAVSRTLSTRRPALVLYPRHERRQPDVGVMATEAVEALREIQPRGPYDILGECLGGVLAFEIARRLGGADTVRSLVLLDSQYPAVTAVSGWSQRVALWKRRRWYRRFRRFLLSRWGRLRGLSTAEIERRLELRGQVIPPPGAGRYLRALARHRLQAWDGAVDFIASEGLERDLPGAWAPFAAAIRVHGARGGHSECLRSRLWDNQGLFRSLFDLPADEGRDPLPPL